MENVSIGSIHNSSWANAFMLPPSAPSLCTHGWLPVNHVLFQLANAFLFLSYWAPIGLYGLLYMRTTLMLGSLFFAIWGGAVLCAFDTLVWNSVFTVINLVHMCILLYMLRPVKLDSELEVVYRDFFMPLKVSRLQFKNVICCMQEIRILKPREAYAIEDVTKVEQLSLLLSGRVVISQKGRVLHVVDSCQFLDSPEWFGVCTGDYYQVSVTAVEESKVLTWHRDKLRLSISSDQFLQAVFDNVLGKDVVKKLMFLIESPSNGINLRIYDEEASSESSTLLIHKMKESRTGSERSVWNLAKGASRDYHDAETTV